MSVLILGTFTKDTKCYLDKSSAHDVGGILYNVVTLACLVNDTILPVANVGYDLYEKIIDIIRGYPQVGLKGIQEVPKTNNHCYLFFVHEYPAEVLVGGVPPISVEQLRPYLTCAAFIQINCVSGFDLTLRTLKWIRKHCAAPIFLDYHLLGLGMDSLGNRFLSRRKDWLQWVEQVDYVQFNEFEAAHAWGMSVSRPGDALKFGECLISHGVKAVIVTLGSKGSLVLYLGKHGIECEPIPTADVVAAVDAGGCGDVYSSAFVAALLRGADVVEACRSGSRYAARKCGMIGADAFGMHMRSEQC